MSENAGKEFMRKTRYQYLPQSAQNQGLPQPPLELPYPATASLLDLPAPETVELPALDLREAIEQRMTVRRYREESLTQEELSALLWLTQGVKRVSDRPVTLRTVPSAGARHAFETYLLINRVAGIAPGLYRYVALEHALLEIDLSEDILDRVVKGCMEQQQVRHSAVTFAWVAVAERMEWRYPVRGYRYLHLDAGHVCQNLYLAAQALGCGVCAIAAFDDELLNTALGLDGETLFAVYLASLGKRAV